MNDEETAVAVLLGMKQGTERQLITDTVVDPCNCKMLMRSTPNWMSSTESADSASAAAVNKSRGLPSKEKIFAVVTPRPVKRRRKAKKTSTAVDPVFSMHRVCKVPKSSVDQ